MLLITDYLMLRLLSSVNSEDKVTRYTLSWESLYVPTQDKILILNKIKENTSDLGNIYPVFKRVVTKLPESMY